jgi:hypothetical protein
MVGWFLIQSFSISVNSMFWAKVLAVIAIQKNSDMDIMCLIE